MPFQCIDPNAIPTTIWSPPTESEPREFLPQPDVRVNPDALSPVEIPRSHIQPASPTYSAPRIDLALSTFMPPHFADLTNPALPPEPIDPKSLLKDPALPPESHGAKKPSLLAQSARGQVSPREARPRPAWLDTIRDPGNEGRRANDPWVGLQRDTFDWTELNVRRMLDGRPPIGRDGSPIILHHRNQQANGPLDEYETWRHRSQHALVHEKDWSEIERSEFATQRERYWVSRARAYLQSYRPVTGSSSSPDLSAAQTPGGQPPPAAQALSTINARTSALAGAAGVINAGVFRIANQAELENLKDDLAKVARRIEGSRRRGKWVVVTVHLECPRPGILPPLVYGPSDLITYKGTTVSDGPNLEQQQLWPDYQASASEQLSGSTRLGVDTSAPSSRQYRDYRLVYEPYPPQAPEAGTLEQRLAGLQNPGIAQRFVDMVRCTEAGHRGEGLASYLAGYDLSNESVRDDVSALVQIFAATFTSQEKERILSAVHR
jgi:hypothetical protein